MPLLHKRMFHLNFDMFTSAMFIFFHEIPKYVQPQSNILSRLMTSTWTAIIQKFVNPLTGLAENGESRLARFHVITDFFANEIYHFSRLPTIRVTHLPGSPTSCKKILTQSLLLVPECYFLWNVEVSVLKFKVHFSQNMLFISCTIFFQLWLSV